MSLLIVALPAPPRLSSHQAAADAQPPAEYDYVYSADGGPRLQAGRAPAAALPKAQAVAAVLPPQGLGWHRVTLPKAPAAKLRAALGGVLEDQLLEDEADLHLALAPQAKAGDAVWVAALNRAWLKSQIDALEADGQSVDRVVPAWPPEDAPAGHFFPGSPLPDGTDPGAQLAWRDADGPLVLPAQSDAARALLARETGGLPVRLTAEPECAAEATRLAGASVAALSGPEFLHAATRSEWNLRQFDLVPSRRGSRAAREVLTRVWTSPTWRPARYGVAALLVLNLVGANVWAWQQRQAVVRQKAAMASLLQQTFPQVRVVTDSPELQMQREMDLLRASAGRPGEGDLEPLLAAADTAWPPSRAAADGLKYEPGRLTITSAGWSPQEVEGFRARLRPLGYDAEAAAGRLTIVPGASPAVDSVPAAAPTGPTAPAPGNAQLPAGTRAVPPLPAAAPTSPAPMNTPAQAPAGARPVPPLEPGMASPPAPRPMGAQGEQPHQLGAPGRVNPPVEQ